MNDARIDAQINHVGISVQDLERARTFWIEGLGAEFHGAFGWPVGSVGADESLALADTAAEVVLLRTDAAFMELFDFTSPDRGSRPGDAPGVRGLVWAVLDVEAARTHAVEHGGVAGDAPDVVLCPDRTPVRLVPAGDGPTGLVGVDVQVADPRAFAVDVTGPVALRTHGGASSAASSPVDLGVNHICLDVSDADVARAQGESVAWHHPVTESSGGLARVCYGTTHDGVLVELLESRSPEAFFSRARLAHPSM